MNAGWPRRSISSSAGRPAGVRSRAALSSSPSATLVRFTEMMTSPGWMPASPAGPAGSTAATTTPVRVLRPQLARDVGRQRVDVEAVAAARLDRLARGGASSSSPSRSAFAGRSTSATVTARLAPSRTQIELHLGARLQPRHRVAQRVRRVDRLAVERQDDVALLDAGALGRTVLGDLADDRAARLGQVEAARHVGADRLDDHAEQRRGARCRARAAASSRRGPSSTESRSRCRCCRRSATGSAS